MDRHTLIIFGAGGHAKMVLEAARAAGGWRDLGVCDDAVSKHGAALLGTTIAGGRDWLLARRDAVAVMPAIGGNALRSDLIAWLDAEGFAIATVVHPRSIVSPSAIVGAGSFVAPGAVVGSETTLAAGAIVNTAASVDHDGAIGRCVHIGPGAHLCGRVRVGAGTLIGVGASVAPGVAIGSGCTIGAGASVIRDLADDVLAIGVPARARP